jgi:hypothetical protein
MTLGGGTGADEARGIAACALGAAALTGTDNGNGESAAGWLDTLGASVVGAATRMDGGTAALCTTGPDGTAADGERMPTAKAATTTMNTSAAPANTTPRREGRCTGTAKTSSTVRLVTGIMLSGVGGRSTEGGAGMGFP